MRTLARIAGVALCAVVLMAAAPGLARAGSLYQQLVINWSDGRFADHDRASFQIPGLGSGNVMCAPNTTWIQMHPADPSAENDFWAVISRTQDGVYATAVREARVYRFSTPTATTPHGTGTSAYLGFNTQTPVEASGSGSLVGLLSRRNGLNAPAGPGNAPTSVHLSWSWSGFGGPQAACHVSATFITAIRGPSRRVAEGVRLGLPRASAIGPVGGFGINWHRESDYPAALRWPSSLQIPAAGTLSGTCQPGPGGLAQLTLTPPAGANPFAEVTTFEGEGIDNATQDDYYTDPNSGLLGPIPLPVNGFIEATLLPAWNASGDQRTQLLVSSIRKLNDPDADNNDCEVAVQAISSPDPIF